MKTVPNRVIVIIILIYKVYKVPIEAGYEYIQCKKQQVKVWYSLQYDVVRCWNILPVRHSQCRLRWNNALFCVFFCTCVCVCVYVTVCVCTCAAEGLRVASRAVFQRRGAARGGSAGRSLLCISQHSVLTRARHSRAGLFPLKRCNIIAQL